MRYNANKGEITPIKAKKRESQRQHNANKGEKSEVKGEITPIKAKKTRKSKALIHQTQMRL